jgi:long-subunit fatty acid transport protein
MKKTAVSLALLFVLFSLSPVFGQKTYAPVIWPDYWYGNEEFIYHTLPIGGWNTLGSFSPRSVAMGETFFASPNGTSGYLNPAFLSVIKQPMFSLNYRYSENSYRTSFWPDIIPMREGFNGNRETHSFKRKTDYVDSISLVLPFHDWVLAANYFLFQEFNFPDINGYPSYWLDTVKQSGKMRGLNLALSYRLTSSFSLGISASYVFGDINRTQVFAPIYYILEDRMSPPGPGVSIPPDWPWWPTTSEVFSLDLKGLFFNLGATFEPNEKWKIGFMLRPPFSIDIKAEVETTFMDLVPYQERSSGDFFNKQPLVATGSVLYKPVDSFELTADVSVWGWNSVTTDYTQSWYYPQDLKSIVKLNLGAEYKVPLPFPALDDLALRVGYIYDPQPFRYAESFSRDYFCAGLGLSIGDLEMGVSAKISLSPRELRRFHANVFQIGATYRF